MSVTILEHLKVVEKTSAVELLRGLRFEIEFLRKAASDLNRLADLKEKRADRILGDSQ